ncbi:hypothetical protein ANOM_002909 [Aspergillus nomiae NRRL 13137]|uniref:Uncharacterized protein n=1 Tax=Aspergillus nomiae NRRL (strain ATCC 15546 / NRRL 13137 / CBS 260.88 / M93) TaxID=1509407 RepID=A0A0L1J8E4_ASPN3|nr:uncharacterized protein ANOM_002909 [Aspergillus nomiae NRRL 13137]KNG88076.1 hypothetical protein ANOM_002909 [Aspergillus nomiae NRRL 13137]
MDGSVVEGISTSLQTCPPDLQGLYALEDLPSPPYVHHLHVNDLGLTPPPGSQPQQPVDAQVPSQEEDHSLPNGSEQGAFTHDQFPGDQKLKASAAGIGPSKLPVQDVDPVGFAGSTDTVQALFDDPLFDSEAVLRELDAAFASRKRAGDEAFPELDFWGPPEKRRLVESQQDHCVPSPGGTPSLSSPDSSHQPEQGGTAPHTPGIERLQSPNPLFDSLDALFEDPDFNVPLIPDDELPPDFELEPSLAQGDQISQEPSNHEPADSNGNEQHLFGLLENSISKEPSVSQLTKDRFSLDSSDLASNISREMLQRIHQEPEYTSPYPQYGGPLGYLPSAPNLHVKYIEVADDRMSYRVSSLKEKIYHLTCERNKYKNAWFEWTTIDPVTGKTREQLLREENAMLRRVSSQHQNRVEQYKREATEWKNKLHDLGTIYNNLLYEIHVQKQVPAVAPVPDSYKPPRTSQVQGHPLTPNSHPVTPAPSGDMQPARQGSQPLPPQCIPPGASDVHGSQQPASSAAERESTPVTIDLTDEMANKPAPPEPSTEGGQRRMEMLQSLRNKKYGWLETGQTGHDFRTLSSQSPRPQQDTRTLVERSHSDPPDHSAAQDDPIDDDDELARAMEAELAEA